MVIKKVSNIFGKWLEPSAVLVKNKEILFLLGLILVLLRLRLWLKFNDHMAIIRVQFRLNRTGYDLVIQSHT